MLHSKDDRELVEKFINKSGFFQGHYREVFGTDH